MNEQAHGNSTLASSRTHWTAWASGSLSMYTALGFLVWFLAVFFPALPLSFLWSQLSFRHVLYLPAYFFSLLLLPLRHMLPLTVQTFLEDILSYVITFLFACFALAVSGKQAWRRGRWLALIGTLLSGVVLVLGGATTGYIYLFWLPNLHLTF